MCRPSRITVLALCLAIQTLPAAAAPTTGESSEAGGDEPSAAAARQPRDVAGPSSGDQTLDRLIQLQPRTAGIEFNERQRSVAAPPRSGSTSGTVPASKATTASPTPPQTPHGLFGAGALPQQASGRADARVVEPPWKQREAMNKQAAAGSDRAGSDTPQPQWLLIPRELVIFIRDHRGWVIGGSLSALALFWAGSSTMARRRSRARA